MMKRITLLIFVLILLLPCFAQEGIDNQEREKAKPLYDTEIVRKVALLDIEGQYYHDVVVTMKSLSPDLWFNDSYRVKVTVTDSKSKTIWKKTLKNTYLYVFSRGQVQVGMQNFDRIVIWRIPDSEIYYGVIREKEGVY